MKLLQFLPLGLVPLFLQPTSRWLAHQHDARLFLGLSSSFWAGVSIGVSIVCGLMFIVLLVLHLLSAQAVSTGVRE